MNNQKINDLLKDPRTNWKFICIVVILGFLAAGGILGYYYLWLTELETKLAEIEVRLPEKVVQDETADWKIYRNEEYGYEVKYPSNWYFYDKGTFFGADLKNCVGKYTDPQKVVLFS